MSATVTPEKTDTDTAAADAGAKVAADKAIADKAVADKAAADKATADAAAAAAATPEAKAAAEKAATDKAAADNAAADAAAAAPKYDLKLPEKSGLEPAVLERTAAIASALKLSPDDAQKMLGLVAQEAGAHATLAIAKAMESHLPGGAVWEKQNADWKGAALADPELGNGKPEQLTARAELGKRVLATFFPAGATEFLEKTGLASHPDTLKGLVKIGQMMKEDELVTLPITTPSKTTEQDKLNRLFPSMAKKD